MLLLIVLSELYAFFLKLRHLNQNRRERPPRLFRPPFFYFVEFFNPLLLIQIPWSYGTEKYELNIWKIRKSNTNSEDLFIINNDDSNQNEVHCQVVKNWKQKFYIDGYSYIPKLIKNRSHCRFKLKWRIIWRRNWKIDKSQGCLTYSNYNVF